jgi:polyferredoxin
MNVKPRLPRKDINCVNCGECIEACNNELGKGRGVFSFSQSKLCTLPPREAVNKPEEALLHLNKPLRSRCYEKTCH